ncbi:RecT family recombinase [Oceanobacillus iheyensis]|uniref:RecT family recombinase n=1 Tax=Oceanobacillus iheyensis TaxID=182710 RepID=UPI003636E0C6
MANNNLPSLTPEITDAFAPQVIEVMRNSIAPTANDQEFLLFAHKAAAYGLDPFKNEIFFIKYGSTARIQFAAEAYLSKAREKEGFQPPDTQMVHENDEFQIAMNKETKEMEVTKHEIGFPRGKIIGAYSIAYRDGHRPVTVIMDITEVEHMFTGQNKENWKKWTADMFGKHVQQRALKKQYGLEFDDETIGQEDTVPGYKRERKDITPNEDVLEDSTEEGPTEELNEEQRIAALRSDMKKKFKKLGITTKPKINEYLQDNNISLSDPTTESELIGLVEILDMHIDLNQSQSANDDELE